MKTIVLVVFVVAACGENVCQNSDYTTEQGICVFEEAPLNHQYVSAVLDIVEEEVINRFSYSLDEMRANYSNTSLLLLPGKSDILEARAYTVSRYVDYGVSREETNKIKVWPQDECEALVDLSHEMLHVLNFTTEGFIEDEGYTEALHPKGWFRYPTYTDQENHESVENIVAVRIRDELCM